MIKTRIQAESNEFRSLDWSEEERTFAWYETGKLNIVYEAVDRWANSMLSDNTALLFESEKGTENYSYKSLMEWSSRWANLFAKNGLKNGDRVVLLHPPSPHWLFAMLGCARLGLIFCPIPHDIMRAMKAKYITDTKPQAIFTTSNLSFDIPAVIEAIPLLLYSEKPPRICEVEISVEEIINEDSYREPFWVYKETPLYMSWVTGINKPYRGIIHGHGDMVGLSGTGKYVLGLGQSSCVWADIGAENVPGFLYGFIVPWLLGATAVMQSKSFSPQHWYKTIENNRVSFCYTINSTIQGLYDDKECQPDQFDLSSLSHLASLGPTIHPDYIFWSKEKLGKTLHETWWMVEAGIIILANIPTMDLKPNSIGLPLPGITVAVLDENYEMAPFLTLGELAIKAPYPGQMLAVWDDTESYKYYFTEEGWFLTGEIALFDEEGYCYHLGRLDDVMWFKYRTLGPWEIESIISEYPEINDTAVVVKRGTRSSASISVFVARENRAEHKDIVCKRIRDFISEKFCVKITVDEVVFLKRIPRNSDGEIRRNILRTMSMGLPVGDFVEYE